MPEQLRRKNKNGVAYVRPPEIEAWLVTLEGTDVAERILQFSVTPRNNASYVPSEALVYFLRRASVEGASGDFERIFRILLARVEQSLNSAIPDLRMVGAPDIREEVVGRFVERIAMDCRDRGDLLDFFEIRFDKALAAIRTSVLRQIGPASVDTVPLGTDREDGLEVSAEVETAAANFLGSNPSELEDPAFRLELTAAIDALPHEQRQVMGLLLQGFQIDSKDPDQMTVARILQCDERTVRNRRDRAYKALKTALRESAL